MARYIALYNDTMVAQKGSLLLKQNLGTRSANLTQGPRGGGSTVKPKTALVSQSCFCSDIYLDPLESCESDKIQPRGHQDNIVVGDASFETILQLLEKAVVALYKALLLY
jgi:hypothetical protein